MILPLATRHSQLSPLGKSPILAAMGGVTKPALDYPVTMAHYWDCEEGTGTLVEDKKGSVDGTLDGLSLPTWDTVEDMGGTVLNFDLGEEIDFPYGSLQYNTDFTFVILMRQDSAAASGKYHSLFSNFIYYGGNNQRGIDIYWDYSLNGLRLAYAYSPTHPNRSDLYVSHATAGVSPGEVHMFSFVIDVANELRIHVDDAEVGQTSINKTVTYHSHTLTPHIGHPSSTSRGIDGPVAWAAIFPAALTGTQIANLYNSCGLGS